MSDDSGVTRHLWAAVKAMDFGDVLGIDLVIGVAGLIGGLVLGLTRPDLLVGAVSVTAGVVGAVIGAVIAATAIQTAFLDQAFLRKLRAIGRDPVTYMTPFLFTTAIGVFSLLGLLVLSTVPRTAPTWLVAPLGAIVGFFSSWAIASLLPLMGTLIQFIGLRQDAIDVPDDIHIKPAQPQSQARQARN
ncbi:hypothetical protein [Mycolicibacterium porcinum]|uniref:Uncharacterized protein n=1 Tax=Mycolicibacterium porcinum TaxID=39693 RepID=A0AAW5SYY6_9MYCO|nr:hypothetical protein [Mycolicibacterium porcinum]MCV7387804.1 hypothetical protein [Mycolicibacterium porcinum]ORB43638.1 hypothetical protein BST41_05860 [Mycolicibacterium porcinum]CDO31521.1 hypothetical protein BN979_04334 [Mycolicibacterium vulneris]